MIDYIKITIVFVVVIVVDYNIIVYCVTGNINIIIVVCRFHCCYSTVQYYYFPLDRTSSVIIVVMVVVGGQRIEISSFE